MKAQRIWLSLAVFSFAVCVSWFLAPEARASEAVCDSRIIVIHVWKFDSLPKELKDRVVQLMDKTSASSDKKGERLSRTLGAELRRCWTKGLCEKWEKPVSVEVLRPIRRTLNISPDSDRISFGNPSPVRVDILFSGKEIISPVQGGDRKLVLFEEEWGSHCVMNMHAIAR